MKKVYFCFDSCKTNILKNRSSISGFVKKSKTRETKY